MTAIAIEQSGTVLVALVNSLRRAGAFNSDAEIAPVAVLWPDGAGQWRQVVPRLRPHLPILTLGDFDPKTSTGPAIWIRAELAAMGQGESTPIIYLPGIGKDVFHNAEDAPTEIQALLYLQYRGTMFLQPNGKDWTLAAYLQNAQHGLGLRVDGSEATRAALAGAAPALLQRSVSDLRQHPGGIDTEFLNTLVLSDLPRRILDWINDPVTARGNLDDAQWTAFCQQLRNRYKLDPERDGPSEAARMLGSAEAGSYWLDIWNRFAEAPTSYAGVPAMLRGAKPSEAGQQNLFGSAESSYHWPQDNEDAETALRQALLSLASRDEAAARQSLVDLEAPHAVRRECVWARLEQAPLAFALAHLTMLAHATASPFPGGDVSTMQASYTESGWQVDAAALAAVSAVSNAEDRLAVDAALSAVYAPWLWDTAVRFQAAITGRKQLSALAPLTVRSGTCVLFADGLRYDLAARLRERLAEDGFQAAISSEVGPLPGVTASAKPAQSPVADLVAAGPKLNVVVAKTGTALSPAGFKKLLADHGWTVLGAGDVGMPDGTNNAWTEAGNIDSYGHNHPHDLPRQATDELERIRQRVSALLRAGWRQVTIVTDHGWLWTPGPMPKTELPQHLTVERKGRCARLTTGSQTNIQTVPWCWDLDIAIAMAPGVSCFEDGKRYEHGGLSLQECIVPSINVTGDAAPAIAATITDVRWSGLRCVVRVAGTAAGMAIDIRQKAADAGTSIAFQMQPAEDGQARVLVEDDANEGLSALVVVLDGSGNVIAHQSTIVGGE